MAFSLHERLQADTYLLGKFQLCSALLMNDACYPWLILVPRRPDVSGLHQLDDDDLAAFWQESRSTSLWLDGLYRPERINVAALGNVVPQLHIHHIARFSNDPAWPGPVWGHSAAVHYQADSLQDRLRALKGSMPDGFVWNDAL